MTHDAGTSGVASVAGMSVIAGAVALSKLRLEGTKLGISAASASLMPPAADGASFVALEQQRESINDYLSKISTGAGHLDQLNKALQSHVTATVSDDEIAAGQINAI